MPCADPTIARVDREIAAAMRVPKDARDEVLLGNLYRRKAGLQRTYDQQVRLIGIARRHLGVPDDAYRFACARLSKGRATGASAMTGAERARLLDEYRAAGWAPPPNGRAKPTGSAGKMRHKVRAMLAAMGAEDAYAEAILARQRKLPAGVRAPLDMADATALRGLIAALDKQQARHARP